MPSPPLTIQRYGITLSRLTADHIEFVRNMRNEPLVSRNMEYRQHITPEMQRRWFARIDNEGNWFFLLWHKGQKIGLISTFNLNAIERGAANAGIFVWQPDLLGTPVPVYAVLAMLDFAFLILGVKKTQVKIKATNKRALAYNRGLGYLPLPDGGGGEFGLHELTAERYMLTAGKLRKVAAKIHGNTTLLGYDACALPQLHQRLLNLPPETVSGLGLVVERI